MRFQHGFAFSAYGMTVSVECEDDELKRLALDVAKKALVGRLQFFEGSSNTCDHKFVVFRDDEKALWFSSQGISSGPFRDRAAFSRTLNSLIRVYVAEKSRGWVFVHAGVVGWKGRAIVLPAKSYQGKTTLVGELLRLGAEYYSDEYAVIDEFGLIHPFERDLSVRTTESIVPTDVPAGEYGGEIGKEPLPAGVVVLTKYIEGCEFSPERISTGIGIHEMIPEVISISVNTKFALKVLNTAFRSAIMLRSLRGEARSTAQSILAFVDDNINFAKFA